MRDFRQFLFTNISFEGYWYFFKNQLLQFQNKNEKRLNVILSDKKHKITVNGSIFCDFGSTNQLSSFTTVLN